LKNLDQNEFTQEPPAQLQNTDIVMTAVAEIQSDKFSATAVALNLATTVSELENPIYELITNVG